MEKKPMRLLLAIISSTLLIFGCGVSETKNSLVIEENVMRYSKHLQIIDHKDYSEVRVLNPKKATVESVYALVPRGQKTTVIKNAIRIETPVKHLAALSTTFIGMLSEIDALDAIAASTDQHYVWNPTLRNRMETGKVAGFGFETTITPELLLDKKIELVMYSGFGQPFPNADKLAQLNIQTFANYDWEEAHPLGKAEWIKLFGRLTGKKALSDSKFKQIATNYLELKKKMRHPSKRTKVLVGGLTGDIWYAPAGKSYMAFLLKNAGFDYIYQNESGTASVSYTLEKVFKDQVDSPVWINAEAISLQDLKTKNGKYAYFQSVKNGEVFGYMHNPNFFWEMGAVHPDWLLEDYAFIASRNSKASLHFYKKLK